MNKNDTNDEDQDSSEGSKYRFYERSEPADFDGEGELPSFWTEDNNTDENGLVERFRQMDEDEQAEILRDLDKYPVSISVLEGLVMVGEHLNGRVPFEPCNLNVKDHSDK